jgi:hypothetical protein
VLCRIVASAPPERSGPIDDLEPAPREVSAEGFEGVTGHEDEMHPVGTAYEALGVAELEF